MKYFLIAGERSGDLHGSNLIKALKKEDPDPVFYCWGGEQMKDSGAELLVHYKEHAFMGVFEVLVNLFKIRRMFLLCHNQIAEINPDVIILIDYGGFNLRIARYASKRGYRVFYYISPKLWAWNTKRAYKVKKYVERMFVILPFEKEFYKLFDCEVDYVGNPVVDAVQMFQAEKELKSVPNDRIIALLPGSRIQEVKMVLPPMMNLARKYPQYEFRVAAVNSLPQELYNVAIGLNNVKLVFENTYNLLSESSTAIVTSGTATLETALLGVPQVVVYKAASWITYLIAKAIVSVKYMSLVNLIANKPVVVELMQRDMNPRLLEAEFIRLTEDIAYRDKMKSEYERIRKILGSNPVSETAAHKMYKYLKKRSKQLSIS
ncbi:lipid-A-disaccharide synthase [Bacteroidota bacterium]